VQPAEANTAISGPRSASAICAALAEFGVVSAQAGDVGPAHKLARSLIGGKMASPKVIGEIHIRTGAGLFVVRDGDRIVGLLAFLLLSNAGVECLLRGDLDTLSPASAHVVAPGEDPAAIYSWAIAAADHAAAQALVGGHERIRHVAVPHLPFYLRPVTPKGRQLAEVRLGFKPLAGSTIGLFWSEPRAQEALEVAA
jgi:hypothetical protein